jgi:hypothetical protein
MTFASACDRIMAICRTQTWIMQAPDDPAAAAVQFPFAAVFPGTGTSKLLASVRQDLHTVHLEIHWTFRDLPRNTGDAKDHIDDILNVLWSDPTLAGKVDTIVSIEYDFGPMTWGLVETLGYLIRITFKQRTAIT